MVESSAYLKRAGVEPCLISRSFRNIGAAHTTLRCPFIYSFPLVKVVVVDYTLLSVIKKTVIPVDDVGIQGQQL